MVRVALVIGACACAVVSSATAAELESTTTPYPGVTHEVWVDGAIPARAHVLRIDLTNQELHLLATREEQRGVTTSAYAAAVGADIAINGDYFSPIGFRPVGLAMGDAIAWADTADDATSGLLSFDRNLDLNHADISPPEELVDTASLGTGTIGVVGGRPMLVRAGVAQVVFDCADLVALPCERAPRAAVGLSADRNTMWLAVVDGWQAGSLGMTAAELGTLLRDRGAHDALMLDGGAAATLFIANEGGVVSSPSDGAERAVANHIGIVHGALTPGQLIGFIRERDVFDVDASIEGALVELDDGQTAITGADGRYQFNDLTPRFACVTASKAGYRTETRCKQILAGDTTFNSIALFPVDEAPDAGVVPDASPVTPDATPGPDAPPAPDAGGGDGAVDGGADGCGCDTGAPRHRGRFGSWAVGALALVLLWSRRRGS